MSDNNRFVVFKRNLQRSKRVLENNWVVFHFFSQKEYQLLAAGAWISVFMIRIDTGSRHRPFVSVHSRLNNVGHVPLLCRQSNQRQSKIVAGFFRWALQRSHGSVLHVGTTNRCQLRQQTHCTFLQDKYLSFSSFTLTAEGDHSQAAHNLQQPWETIPDSRAGTPGLANVEIASPAARHYFVPPGSRFNCYELSDPDNSPGIGLRCGPG